MRSIVAFFLLCALCLAVTHADRSTKQSEYENLKAEAEKLYAEASYSKAREVYVKALTQFPEDRTLWRRFGETLYALEEFGDADRIFEILVNGEVPKFAKPKN